MAISFECGDCAKKYKVDARFAGKKIKCKECDATMTIPAADPSEAPPKSDLFDDWDVPESRSATKASKPADDDFADDDMGEAASPPPRVTRSAPAARKSASAGEAAKKSKPRRTESEGGGAPNFLIYTASGLVGGAIGAAVWGGIVYATQHEIGWIAWGLGLLVGFCVRLASANHHDGFLPGIVAAIISVGSICAGKFLAASLFDGVKFEDMFGGMDILFFLLAIITAFRLGSGGDD